MFLKKRPYINGAVATLIADRKKAQELICNFETKGSGGSPTYTIRNAERSARLPPPPHAFCSGLVLVVAVDDDGGGGGGPIS